MGGAATVCDLAVELRSPQELTFVAQKVPIRAVLHSSGLAGQQASVSLVDEQEHVLGKKTATLNIGKPVEVQFEVERDRSGVFRYEVRADPLPGEVTTADNQATFMLRVIDEPIRVLLLEGKPYWDTKFLLRTLAADRSIELVSVVKLAESRFMERTLKRPVAEKSGTAKNAAAEDSVKPNPQAAAKSAIVRNGGDKAEVVLETPTASAAADAPAFRPQDWKILTDGSQLLADAKSLDTYQVVILGRDAEAYLNDEALAQLRRWLRESGGSLVCFRGSPTAQINQHLATLLPVRWEGTRESRFHMRLTEQGRDLRWLPTDDGAADADPLLLMPTLATRAQPLEGHSVGETWAVGESDTGKFPVVSSRPFGVAGRVVVVEGAGMWRWALLPPKYAAHESIYGALWQSLIRWLVSNPGLLPTQKWKLSSDQVRFHTAEAATATLQIREAALSGTLPGALPAIELRKRGEEKIVSSVRPAPLGDEPGAYRAAFGRLPEGRYEARIAGSAASDSAARTLFDVNRNLDEMLKLDANPALMKRISAASGGVALESASAEELAAQLSEHLAHSRQEQIRTATAWDRWWVLAGVFGLWGCSWGLRRWSGLI